MAGPQGLKGRKGRLLQPPYPLTKAEPGPRGLPGKFK